MGLAGSRVGKFRSLPELRVADSFTHLGPEVLLAWRHDDVRAVATAECLPGCDERVGGALWLLIKARVEKQRADVGKHLDHHVKHREIEMLTVPTLAPALNSGKDGDCCKHPGQQVGDRYPHDHRWAPGLAHDGHVPGHGLQDEIVRGQVAVGAVDPEAGNRDENNLRVGFPHPIEVDPQALEHTGSEVLDDRVRRAHEIEEGLPPTLRLEVENDALLVAVVHDVDSALVAHAVDG
jgi:hypothetical protein